MKRYNDYSTYIKNKFNQRVQKISVNTGLSCPNRDGTKSRQGCIYCDNNTFSPYYCDSLLPVKDQLQIGINFFAKKYRSQKYLAYFQSYTNTYGSLDLLEKLYFEALSVDNVIGLAIATRPDCIDDDVLKLLKKINQVYYVVIEFGVESTINKTLKTINRCHTFEDSVNALYLTEKYEIDAGVHLILGLPGENRNDFIYHAKQLSKLPVKTLKLHQLQIIKNTKAEKLFLSEPEQFINFSVEDYIATVVDFLEYLNPEIVIERFVSESPPDMLVAPKWGRLKNFEIITRIEKELIKRDTFQGAKYK
ncbi:MAG: TIGR01212 family radical SAM protein [Marinilabiliales bacterium]